jgi:hypothetical protein
MIVFYLIGSRATKMGKERKQKLEEGVDLSGGGYRTAAQVRSCDIAFAGVRANADATLITFLSVWSWVYLRPTAKGSLKLFDRVDRGCCLGRSIHARFHPLRHIIPVYWTRR